MAFGALSLKLSIKGRALRYLAQREHSRVELERKLARFAAEDGPTDAAEDGNAVSATERVSLALDDLAAKGLISEARVAESVLASQGRRFGTRRLKQTLQAKGLDAELVSTTLQEARATELGRAHEVWQRKFGSPATDAAGRAKQVRFLVARGFDGDVIRRVVAGGVDEADAD
jgi:regulatory protein